MTFKKHLQSQSLAQLETDWRSLTYAQRITLRLMAEADLAMQNTRNILQRAYTFPLSFLAYLYTYSYEAHWAAPQIFEKKKNSVHS